MKILFLVPYPIGKSPSQRFRFEQYFSALSSRGFTWSVQSFLSDAGWNVIYRKGNNVRKVAATVAGFLRRIRALFIAGQYEFIFIHREATPLGPPFIEWVLARVLRKRIIYDFDDAIWLTDKTAESRLEKLLRWRSKVGAIITWSYRVSCGNEYLCQYARRYSANVVLNPTTIDTNYHKPASVSHRSKLTIGWTGTHSTMKYLAEVATSLQAIARANDVDFLLISNDTTVPTYLPASTAIKWSKESEIEDLQRMDIGIMPLPNDEWSMGKCGFKALQYMALGIPAVVSPVGVNTTIVTNEINGLVCHTEEEWINALQRLIADPALRSRLGAAGRQKVLENYSVASNTSTFLELFS